MSNKSLLAFLLLLVLGGAFWMWTLEGDGAPDQAVDPLTQQPEVADPRGTASSAATPTEVAAKPEASAEVSARQLVDAQPEAQPAVESDDDLMLTVVEHATGAQVAGAVVSVLRTGGSGPNATLSGLLMTGLENTLRLNPQNVIATAESNADGIVRLPASAGSEVIVAQWLGQHGLTVLEWGYDMGTTIRVAPPSELRFRFVDDLGQPVLGQKLIWSDSKLPRDLALFWRPRTSNVVLIREAASLMAPLVEALDGHSLLNVSAAEALNWKAPTLVDLRVDRDVNVLALTSASVRVALVDAAGQPMETDVSGPMTLRVDGDLGATRVESVGPDGRAEFRGVPIGADVSVQFRYGSQRVKAEGVVAKGGLDLTLEVLREIKVTLRAQLVDDSGAELADPWCNVHVSASGGTQPGSASVFHETPLKEGRVEVSSFAWHRQLESGATLDVQFRVLAESGSYESEVLQITQATLGDGNLGVVSLTLKPDLVRGRVLDSKGRPVAGAIVTLMASTDSGQPRQVFDANAEASASDGSFRVTGSMPDGEVWLSAQLGLDRHSRPQLVERYTADLDVVLLNLASVEFSIDPSMVAMSSAYVFEVMPEEELLRIASNPQLVQALGSFSGGWRHVVPNSGSMQLRGLLPGFYTFQLQLKKTGEVVREWPHIELHEGETLRAASMQNVPVTAQGELVRLEVVNDQGVRLLDYVLLSDNGQGVWVPRRITTPEFLVDAFPTLAIVQHKGYLLEPVVIDAPQIRVDLQPEFDVTLRFPSDLKWPAGTRAQLMPIDVYSVSSTSASTPSAPWTQGEPAVDNGLVTLKVTSAGQHWVALCLPQKHEDVGWEIKIDRENHPTLNLDPSQAGAVIDVALSQAELDALLALK